MSATQRDVLQELVNIGLGQAASILNDMVQSHIELQVPSLDVMSLQEAKALLQKKFSAKIMAAVGQKFNTGITGMAQLIFPTDSASTLVAALAPVALDSEELDGLKIGTLMEVGNIIINGVMGSISNALHQRLTYSLPVYLEDDVLNLLTPEQFNENIPENITVILAQTCFTLAERSVTGNLILVFKLNTLEALLDALILDWKQAHS